MVIASVFPPLTHAQEGDSPEYVVQSGDSLYSISQAFGSSVDELQAANDINDPSLIVAGHRLQIPGFKGISGGVAIRTLDHGDTLSSLIRALDTDRMSLILLNRIVNPAALYLRQPIIYPLSSETQSGVYASPGGGQLRVANKSDTLASLAAASADTIATLSIRNALSSSSDVYPGRHLFVATDTPVTGLPHPMTEIRVIPDRPVQGDPVVVVVQSQNGASISGTLGEEMLHFVSTGNGSLALHGVWAMKHPGTYPLVIHAELPSGGTTAFETRVPIADPKYQYQAIALPQDKSGLLSDYAGTEFDRIQSIASSFSSERLWKTPFSPPLVSEYITATFGLRRSYDGGPYDTFHSGVDFGMPIGTPILAPASGVVVVAEAMRIRGNGTVIDHGWGVYTAYWHQSRILVSSGQTVSAGEIIGYVGDSGLSTGTHLHWEVWVGGHQINPMAWIGLEIQNALQR